MKRKNWVVKSLIAVFTVFLLSGATSAYARTNAESTLSYDPISKTLTVGEGTTTNRKIIEFIGTKTEGSIRSQYEHLVLEGSITIQMEKTTQTLGIESCFSGDKLSTVQTKGNVTFIENSDSNEGPFFESPSLEAIDLSHWDIRYQESSLDVAGLLNGWFQGCANLKTVNLGGNGVPFMPEIATQYVMCLFALTSQSAQVPESLPLLQDVSFMAGVDMLPITGQPGNWSGSFFPYDKEGGWNAYQDGVLQASGLSSYEAFRAYQESHPGMTRYVWVGAPQPTPDPDPEPTPDPEPEPTPDVETHAGWEWTDAGWRYYTDNDSYLTDGWHWVASEDWGAHWYYFSTDGAMCTGWIWDGSWYYCNPAGDMAYGVWQWIDGEWYGFWYNGTMCTGWIWDSGYNAWFYCYNNGVMARNAWVDGYYLSNSGICLL